MCGRTSGPYPIEPCLNTKTDIRETVNLHLEKEQKNKRGRVNLNVRLLRRRLNDVNYNEAGGDIFCSPIPRRRPRTVHRLLSEDRLQIRRTGGRILRDRLFGRT